MVQNVTYGSNIVQEIIENCGNYLVATNPIPWDSWSKQLQNQPVKVIYCQDMEETHLEQLLEDIPKNFEYVVGFGGGIACDTGKFLAWKMNKKLITVPSIISVDAFLCEAIGVRHDDRVHYIGAVKADKIVVDYNLIKSAPVSLNYGGIGDSLSCATALGDWRIANNEFGDSFNPKIYQETTELVHQLLKCRTRIHDMNEEGIHKMVEFLLWEIRLCEEWGNARPEEGGEHFLAYAIEKIRPARYLHGALIALNVLIVLRMQGKDAIWHYFDVKKFLDDIGLKYSPKDLGIPRDDFRKALEYVPKYVEEEKLFHGIWNRSNVFQNESIDVILDWIYAF